MNTRFFKKLLLTASLTLSLALPVTILPASRVAADGVGYVDGRRLIDQSPQGKDIIKELEAEFAARSRELNGRFDIFKAKQQELEKNSVLLTAEELQSKADDLRGLQRQLRRARREYEEDYARRRDQRIDTLEKAITEVIIAVAKREKLDLVFQQAVYASPDIDLTERVLAALKKHFKSKK